MKHDYEWVEKLEDGTKRTVRVSFPGGGKIVWMDRRADDERWNRHMTPATGDWDFLETKVRGRYNRRRATIQDVERVVVMRQNHA
jgi:hypothetical protein